MDLIQYHEFVSMIAFRREDLAAYFVGAAAVCTVMSIAAFELLMGAAVLVLIATRTRWRVPRNWLPLVVFMGATVASLFASGHLRQGFPQIKKFYVYLMLFLVVSAIRTMRQVRWIALGWALAASLSAAVAVNQFYNKYEDAKDAHVDFYMAYIASRISGFMSHWMTFSGHMMMALMVVGALVFFSTNRKWVGWLVAAGGLIGVGLVLAETRSMWFGAAVGATYLLWFWKRWVLIAVPVLVGILLLVNPFELGDRVRSGFTPHSGDLDSNAHRAMCRAIGYRMIAAHPWLGVGPERVGPEHLDYLPPGTKLPLPTGYYGHLHNIYIQYAAERGVPAMLALMWFLGMALYDFVRALRRTPQTSERRWVLHAAIAAMIAVLIGGFYEYNLNDSEVLAMFLAIMGCGYAAVMQTEDETCKDLLTKA
jgi:putative inorganic carbon (HCO3(-)) transporter